MTTKLSNEQKKYNKLVDALNNTWNCDYKCDVLLDRPMEQLMFGKTISCVVQLSFVNTLLRYLKSVTQKLRRF